MSNCGSLTRLFPLILHHKLNFDKEWAFSFDWKLLFLTLINRLNLLKYTNCCIPTRLIMFFYFHVCWVHNQSLKNKTNKVLLSILLSHLRSLCLASSMVSLQSLMFFLFSTVQPMKLVIDLVVRYFQGEYYFYF